MRRRVTRVPRLPPRDAMAHKGTFGTVLVVAGSEGMLGAALLAATAALRGGAGLVQVAVPRALRPFVAVGVPCATSVDRGDAAAMRRALAGAAAVVVGPGLGQTPATRRLVRGLLRASAAPLVLDADALNVLAPLRRPLAAAAPVVLTPHPGEAARLLDRTAAAVQRDRGEALARLQDRSGAVVVLKGAGTLVADAQTWFRNTTGNPGMATGGSGDVLAGLLGALLAQGMAPFAAACLAVHAHGRAGDRVAARRGQIGLVASDLPDALAEVLR